MPPSLLHSQFVALEEPGADENPIVVSIAPRPGEIVAHILSALNAGAGTVRPWPSPRSSDPASVPHPRASSAKS